MEDFNFTDTFIKNLQNENLYKNKINYTQKRNKINQQLATQEFKVAYLEFKLKLDEFNKFVKETKM